MIEEWVESARWEVIGDNEWSAEKECYVQV